MNLSEKDIARFWSHVEQRGENECWEWQASERGGQGYGSFWLQGKTYQAHRVSYFIVHGNLENLACHTCDNRKCVNPNHLFDGTYADNTADAMQKGRMNIELHPENLVFLPKGEAHPAAKLTSDNVKAIRELYAQGWGQRDLAARFGTEQTNISRVVKRKTWRHI